MPFRCRHAFRGVGRGYAPRRKPRRRFSRRAHIDASLVRTHRAITRELRAVCAAWPHHQRVTPPHQQRCAHYRRAESRRRERRSCFNITFPASCRRLRRQLSVASLVFANIVRRSRESCQARQACARASAATEIFAALALPGFAARCSIATFEIGRVSREAA